MLSSQSSQLSLPQALPPDSILIDTLHLSANIGLDCWNRSKPQPIGLSVYLLLPNGSLNLAALSDDVADSVHYGDLTKAIVKFVEGYEPPTPTTEQDKTDPDPNTLSTSDHDGSSGIVNFVDKLTIRIFHFLAAQQQAPSATLTTPLVQSSSTTSSATSSANSSDSAIPSTSSSEGSLQAPTVVKVQPAATAAGVTSSAIEVRIVLHLPKFILLAPNFQVEIVTPSPSSIGTPDQTRIVEVKDLDLPVIIGVNPPERQLKQRVKTSIVFREGVHAQSEGGVDYRQLVLEIEKLIEDSAYLTLERFVYQIAQYACTASPHIDSVTVRAQKPSAIPFAESSGVEITRSRLDFRSTGELTPS